MLVIGAAEVDAFVCRVGTHLMVKVEALGAGVTIYSVEGVVLQDDEYINCTLAPPNEEDEEDRPWGYIR